MRESIFFSPSVITFCAHSTPYSTWYGVNRTDHNVQHVVWGAQDRSHNVQHVVWGEHDRLHRTARGMG
jgi:hypothetical protein